MNNDQLNEEIKEENEEYEDINHMIKSGINEE